MNFTASKTKFLNSLIIELRPYYLLQVGSKPVALYSKVTNKIIVSRKNLERQYYDRVTNFYHRIFNQNMDFEFFDSLINDESKQFERIQFTDEPLITTQVVDIIMDNLSDDT